MREAFLRAHRAAALAVIVSVAPVARAQEAEPAAASSAATAEPLPVAPVPASPPPTTAAVPLPPVRFFFSTGWDYGFNELLKVQFEDGSTGSLRLNGGFRLAIGAAFLPLQGGRFETRGTAGIKYDWLSAENGRVTSLAFQIELLESLNLRPLRLSAGLSVLLAPSVKGQDFLAAVDLDLRNSLGLVGQAEWVFPFDAGRRSLSIGLRFTWQKLELETGGKAEDASALGAVLGVTF
jgi:hypothetical protein